MHREKVEESHKEEETGAPGDGDSDEKNPSDEEHTGQLNVPTANSVQPHNCQRLLVDQIEELL